MSRTPVIAQQMAAMALLSLGGKIVRVPEPKTVLVDIDLSKVEEAALMAMVTQGDEVLMADLMMLPSIEDSEGARRALSVQTDIPDRLSLDHRSKFYTNVGHYVRVSLNGEEVPGCVEYCVSGGWVRLATPGPDGKVTRDAVAKAEKTKGVVTTEWRMTPSRQVKRMLRRIGS